MPTSPPLEPLEPVSQPPAPPEDTAPPSPWQDAPLASVTWRLGGFLLDGVLVVCTVFVGWLAWWIIDWDSGRSPAKSILHTRVVRADNRELPGFGRMAVRELIGKGIPAGAGLIGFSMLGDGGNAGRFLVAASLAWFAMSSVAALLDAQRRTLWDAMAGTNVVLDPDVADVAPTSEERTEQM
jgi:hypothetical protein